MSASTDPGFSIASATNRRETTIVPRAQAREVVAELRKRDETLVFGSRT